MELRKVYELKKGMKLIYNDEIIIFEEIIGDKAIFYNEWGEKFIFDDFLDIDEIGEIISKKYTQKTYSHPTLF